jgi:hypothetical protein
MASLTEKDLESLSMERLQDARALYSANRYDGAFYICGYAVELGLKRKICKTLGWIEYPNSAKDKEKYKSFLTHDLEVLLHFSGVEQYIRQVCWDQWSVVTLWKPEIRYSSEKQTDKAVKLMIESAETLLENL